MTWDRCKKNCKVHEFLLTHPVWDVTNWQHVILTWQKISTHTSRVGCDDDVEKILYIYDDFYSHIPCGMWLELDESLTDSKNFYSHIPCGMWHVVGKGNLKQKNFYSHIPCGMWLYPYRQTKGTEEFLLTHPVWDVTPIADPQAEAHGFLLTHPVWDVT